MGPEKSGQAGLSMLRGFLSMTTDPTVMNNTVPESPVPLSKRVVACLDVREDEKGKLVVTKGVSYDVMEESDDNDYRVRNLGDPVEMAEQYFQNGVDELTFLSIMSHSKFTLEDLPMLNLLERISERVFVPLTIGGGIRTYKNNGIEYSALEIANRFFRSGADKVSIGSDAVRAVQHLQKIGTPDGTSSIEQISGVFGKQAVVISVDPKRIYLDKTQQVQEAEADGHKILTVIDQREESKGRNVKVWYSATIKGGQIATELDAIDLVRGVEALGAGEILLNCIDTDGSGSGFDLELIKTVCDATSLPVIASSGAGSAAHFSELFSSTRAEAGLAAGIFHRNEVTIPQVKEHLIGLDLPARLK